MHTQGLQETVCVCTVNHNGSRDVRGCNRCWHWRSRKRLKVSIHEDYLPQRGVSLKNCHAAAIVLELACQTGCRRTVT